MGCEHSCPVHAVVQEPHGEAAAREEQLALYNKAKAGDMKATVLLMEIRREHEYENWDIEQVIA